MSAPISKTDVNHSKVFCSYLVPRLGCSQQAVKSTIISLQYCRKTKLFFDLVIKNKRISEGVEFPGYFLLELWFNTYGLNSRFAFTLWRHNRFFMLATRSLKGNAQFCEANFRDFPVRGSCNQESANFIRNYLLIKSMFKFKNRDTRTAVMELFPKIVFG